MSEFPFLICTPVNSCKIIQHTAHIHELSVVKMQRKWLQHLRLSRGSPKRMLSTVTSRHAFRYKFTGA